MTVTEMLVAPFRVKESCCTANQTVLFHIFVGNVMYIIYINFQRKFKI